ncbi:hypothetical protein OIU79_025828 [Salix purpurea]|uniref:Secreted protein n=1 Tax=Salix purpurea TaxID=77065 RepID=A0A9Q1A7T6_SALPP|nr:hypothetical protein OIU79_025828 [Salix purpurea]
MQRRKRKKMAMRISKFWIMLSTLFFLHGRQGDTGKSSRQREGHAFLPVFLVLSCSCHPWHELVMFSVMNSVLVG